MGDNVVEVVMFDMKTEVARADFLTGAGEASDWLRIQPGFVSRELFEVGDQRWLDIVHWSTMDAARTAAERLGHSESCAGFLATIDLASVRVIHGTPVIAAVRV